MLKLCWNSTGTSSRYLISPGYLLVPQQQDLVTQGHFIFTIMELYWKYTGTSSRCLISPGYLLVPQQQDLVTQSHFIFNNAEIMLELYWNFLKMLDLTLNALTLCPCAINVWRLLGTGMSPSTSGSSHLKVAKINQANSFFNELKLRSNC